VRDVVSKIPVRVLGSAAAVIAATAALTVICVTPAIAQTDIRITSVTIETPWVNDPENRLLVGVEYECSAGEGAEIYVTAHDSHGPVHGQGNLSVTCDGATQADTIVVRPFEAGPYGAFGNGHRTQVDATLSTTRDGEYVMLGHDGGDFSVDVPAGASDK
jgi:hypothetical protein